MLQDNHTINDLNTNVKLERDSIVSALIKKIKAAGVLCLFERDQSGHVWTIRLAKVFKLIIPFNLN